MNLETIIFENNTLRLIDQTVLPQSFQYQSFTTLEEVIRAIKTLTVRGAPAIGITAAYGLYLHALQLSENNHLSPDKFKEGADLLKNARPTAINLSWAVDAIYSVFTEYQDDPALLDRILDKALEIHGSDKNTCDKIGTNGAALFSDSANVITHCNAGALATGGIGTALATVYKAHEQGKNIHVYVDETRPVGQGARLTLWELSMNKIPATLITDNMAASLFQQQKIDMVIVGADRILKNGDTANKIGTYNLSVLAYYHGIPFYVAAPLSTFDLTIESGDKIPIELRDSREILGIWGINDDSNYNTYNPAFDITPGYLISGIITEQGVIRQPYNNQIHKYFTNYI